MVSGHPWVALIGDTPIKFEPRVTISAPTDGVAKEYEVEFAQNVLPPSFSRCIYSNGRSYKKISFAPSKDGASESYDELFVEQRLIKSFQKVGQTLSLRYGDAPQFSAPIYHSGMPSQFQQGIPTGTLETMTGEYKFRLWVVVRHKATGLIKPLWRIDWHTEWQLVRVPGPRVAYRVRFAKSVVDTSTPYNGETIVRGRPLTALTLQWAPETEGH